MYMVTDILHESGDVRHYTCNASATKQGYRASHCLPQVPEEILTALQWARTHDEEAQRIGQAAQEIATKYLSRAARACYWFK